ncbi:hypothetical protein GOP47_0018457 [Adiantum capillus-veneris]|uniref:Uncharacterized protein n=1 Tax=Adiantum capillus-veneris TaxID=13818 RepID=A0A9D4UD55_ADICA|nr:hypothetical protein GOP47_0018457 [Adiantum capillus-veneris]
MVLRRPSIFGIRARRRPPSPCEEFPARHDLVDGDRGSGWSDNLYSLRFPGSILVLRDFLSFSDSAWWNYCSAAMTVKGQRPFKNWLTLRACGFWMVVSKRWW